jgi:hypothetical protein
VGALLDDLSLLEYADEVGVADGGESVGDDEGGASFQEAIHVALDHALGFAVQGACRFVEDQHRGFVVERLGDRHALRLAAGDATSRTRRCGFGSRAIGFTCEEPSGPRDRLARIPPSAFRPSCVGRSLSLSREAVA